MQPNQNSRLVAVLSNEVVKVNQQIEQKRAEQRGQEGQYAGRRLTSSGRVNLKSTVFSWCAGQSRTSE